MHLIKELTKEQLITIYKENINRHFPADEIKPLEVIERMLEMDFYYGLGMYNASEEYEYRGIDDLPLIGYALFVKDTQENILLLDYFAIVEEYRNGGWGSIFLKEMKKMAENYRGILLEIEDIDFAKDEEERKLRERRDSFYKRNGIIKTDVKSKIFGVNYVIWNYPIKETLSFEECREGLTNIYKMIASGPQYERFVEIVTVQPRHSQSRLCEAFSTLRV